MPRKKAEDAASVSTKGKTSKVKAEENTSVEKKGRKAPCKTSVCVEMNGLSVSVTDIQNAVKKAVKDKGLNASDVKIYINAAEKAAYYTVDGEGGEDSRIDLANM